MTNGWKITAIIFMTLFIIETFFVGYGAYLVIDEEEKSNECYYNFCSNHEEATYNEGICLCYDWNEGIQEYEVAKEIYIK